MFNFFKILGHIFIFIVCFDILIVFIATIYGKAKTLFFRIFHINVFKKEYVNNLKVNMFGDISPNNLEVLKEIPKELAISFNKHGFKIILLSERYFYDYAFLCERGYDCVGFFAPYRKEIVLLADDKYFKESLFHEFGHFCDYLRGDLKSYASNGDCVVEDERKVQYLKNELSDYYVESPVEFVAFCVSEYLSGHLISDSMINIAKRYLEVSFKDATT